MKTIVFHNLLFIMAIKFQNFILFCKLQENVQFNEDSRTM